MSLLYPAGQTPYLGRAELTSAPTGITWATLPPGSQVTEQQRIAERSTSSAARPRGLTGTVNQVLRATIDTEQISGPDYRVTIQVGAGNGRVILPRWPVLSITQVQVSPKAFPRQWTTVPAGYYDIEHPVSGLYGTVAPRRRRRRRPVGPHLRRLRQLVQRAQRRPAACQYINGWPHTCLTAAAPVSRARMSIAVDDCTGWAITGEFGQQGAAGIIYDSGQQETVQVTAASATSGPGTLTLSSALQFTHASRRHGHPLPQSVIDAMILFSAPRRSMRGATSTTVHQIPGGAGGTAGGKARGPAEDYITAGRETLRPFRRTDLTCRSPQSSRSSRTSSTACPCPAACAGHGGVHHAAGPERGSPVPDRLRVADRRARIAGRSRARIPRNTGPGTPAGFKPINHMVDVFIVYFLRRRRPAGRLPLPGDRRRGDVRAAHLRGLGDAAGPVQPEHHDSRCTTSARTCRTRSSSAPSPTRRTTAMTRCSAAPAWN